MHRAQRRGLALLMLSFATQGAAAGEPSSGAIQLDPFARTTSGYPGCPETPPPLVTPEQMRIIAHERAERGTRCALEGKCEPGGAYKRDPEVNERVRTAIAGDKRFATTSVWVTTTRRFVTLSGCVRSAAQQRALATFVRKQPGVERVLDETRIGTTPAHASTAAPR